MARFAYGFIDTKTDQLVSTALGVVFDDRIVRIIDILTEKSHRNRGLASTLFSYLLQQIHEDPTLKSLELEASASGSRLYEKFSFCKDYPITSYFRPPSPLEKGTTRLDIGQDLERVMAFDAKASGFSRDQLFREMPSHQILVDRQGEKIGGFLCYFEDSTGIRIGPWAQGNSETAEPFFQTALEIIRERYPTKQVYIHLPELGLKKAHQIVEKLGFKIDPKIQTVHMSKGDRILRDPHTYLAMWSTNWA